jgi:VCBS repeat-containing protein
MRRSALFLVTLAAFAWFSEPLMAEVKAVIPIVGSTGGANGANFRTELQLHNLSPVGAKGRLWFRAMGSTESEAIASLPYELAPNATLAFRDVVEELGRTGLGSIDIDVESGATPNIVARAYDDQGAAGTKGVSVPVIRVANAIGTGQTAAIIAPADPVAARLNLGIRTLGEGATFRITIYNADGSVKSEIGERSYGGNFFLQQSAGDYLGAAVAANESIAFHVVSGSAVVYGTMTDNKTNDPSIQVAEKRNTVPRIDDISLTANNTGTTTIRLIAADPDGEELMFTVKTAPTAGTLGPITRIDRATAEVVYTPTAAKSASAFTGDSFEVRVDDENGGSDSAKVSLTAGTNEAPVAHDDSVTTQEDRSVDILMEATDPDGDTLSFAITSGPSNGSLGTITMVDANKARVRYTPSPNYFGSDSFEFTVSDPAGLSDVGEISINVTSAPDTPQAVNDSYTVAEDGTLAVPPSGVLANDHDSDGDSLSAQLVSGPTNGTLVLNANGGFTYTPTAGFTGTDSFTYRASDGALQSSATVTITVTSVNDAPSFTGGGNVTVNEDSGAYSATWATGISAGPPAEAGQTLTFNVTGNTNPTLFADGPRVLADGTLQFTPAANASGAATITVVLQDNGGTANGGLDTSAAVSFTITVNPVNDAPSFTKGADVTVFEDNGTITVSPWATGMSAGPADEAGQTLTFNITGNTNPSLFTSGPTVAADGSLGFDLAGDAFGTATITLTLSDNGGTANGGVDTSAAQTFVITVTSVNDAPSFTEGADVTVAEDSGAYSAAWATAVSVGPASEASQTPSFMIHTNSNPALFSDGPRVLADGTLQFTPAANASGTATITLALHDDGGTANGGVDMSAEVTLVITVTSVNDNPTATDDGATVLEDSGANAIDVLANDSMAPDTGETLTITGVTQGANGSVSFTAANVSYTPNANFFGTDSFTYTISDGNGGTATATVNVTVSPVNDGPVNTVPAAQTVNQNATLVFSSGGANAISTFDLDATAPRVTLTVTSGDLTLSGTAGLTFTAGDGTNDATMTFTGTVAAINTALEGLVYTPVGSFSGAVTLTITTEDLGQTGLGGPLTDSDTVTITVNDINDAPVNALPAAQTVNEDTVLVLSTINTNAISISDVDAGGATVEVTLTATNGVLTLGGTTGLVFSTGDGSADATMTFQGTIAAINTALNGLSYAPTADYFGAGSITITTNDLGNSGFGGAQSDTDVLTVTVNAVNDAPSFTPGANVTVAEDSGAYSAAWATALLPGPASEAGQTLTFVIDSNTNTALFSSGPTILPDGTLQFTPALNASGSATLVVRLTDDGGTANGGVDSSGTVNLVITVTPLNDNPTAVDDAATVAEDSGPNAINVLGNDSDAPDSGETLTITGVTQGTSGSVAITGGGTGLTYSPNANFFGNDSFTYTISDGNGGTDTATVNVTVTAVNDAPINAVPAAQNVNQNATLVFSSGNGNAMSIADVDATAPQVTLTVTSGDLTLSGTAGLTFTAGDGTNDATMTFTGSIAAINTALEGLVYTPLGTFAGGVTLTLTTEDLGQTGGGNLVDSDTVAITVNDINDAPVNSLPVAQTINEEVTLTLSTGNGNAISISDVDAGANTVQVTLTTAEGLLTLSGTTGLSFSFSDGNGTGAGDGTADATMTFRGTIVDINTALNGLTFTPTVGFAGAATITITTNDLGNVGFGGAQSDTDALTVNVTAINDAPVNTVPGAQATNEDTLLMINGISVADDAGTNPVEITLGVTNGTLSLASLTGLTFTGGANGTSSMVFTGTLTDVNAALASVQYTPTANYSGGDTLVLTTNDQGNTGTGGPLSDSDNVAITVSSVNDAPSGADNTVTTLEETQYTFTAADFGFTDPNDTPAHTLQAVVIATLPVNGTLTNSGAGFAAGTSIPVADINAGNLKFTPAANGSGSPYASFTFRVQDNGGTANGGVDLDPTPNTMTVNVTPVNDAPAGTNNTVAAVEDGQYTFTAADFGFTDPSDTPGNALQSVLITTLPGAGTLTLSGGGFAAGTDITVADINAGNLKFAPAANASGSPYTTFTFQVRDDGGTANSGVDLDPTPNTMTVNVTPVNDAPAGTDNTVATDEDVQFTFAAGHFGFTDPSDTPANALQSVVITSLPAAGSLTLSGSTFVAGTEISVANITAGNLKFLSALNAFGTPYTTFTFQVRDNGGTANGGVDLDPTPNTITVNVNPVNDAPVAGNDAFDTIGNTELRVDLVAGTTPNVAETTSGGTGVRENDNDPIEGDPIAITSIVGCLDVTAPFDCVISGAVISMNANGSFTYTPSTTLATGAPTTATFQYVVTDQPAVGTPATATGTVTISVYDKVWYVKQGAAGGNGTSALPLGSFTGIALGDGTDSDAPGDYIFVQNTGADLTSSIVLEANQHLLGEGVGLSIPRSLNGDASPKVLVAPGIRPVVKTNSGNVVSIGNAIPIEIRGLSLNTFGAGLNAIDLTANAAYSGSATLTIADNTITGTPNNEIAIDINAGGTGTLNLAIADMTMQTGAGALAMDITRTAGTLNIVAFHDLIVPGTTGGGGIAVTGTGAVVTFVGTVPGGTTVIGSSIDRINGAGLTLSNVAGTLTYANLAAGTVSVGDLDIFTDTGAALDVTSGTGGFTINATPNQATLLSNAGPALLLNGTTGGITTDLQLLSLTSLASGTNGVGLTNVVGTFSAPNGSTIQSATGTDFLISGGTANVTYGGTIYDNAGQLISIANTTSGNKLFTGAIDDLDGTTDPIAGGAANNGGGISLASNTGATITFSGGMQLSTGATAAFTATGGGTLSICDENPCNAGATGALINRIVTTTGTALNVANTSIAANNLEFRSIFAGTGASGPANAIVLNSTGSAGGLKVKGDNSSSVGGNASGGLIQNTTGDAISLTSTFDPSFVNVTIQGASLGSLTGSGVRGTQVTNFTFRNGTINNVGHFPDATNIFFDESNIRFDTSTAGTEQNLTGVVTITNNILNNATWHGVDILNFNGTISDLNISGNQMTSGTTTGGGGTSKGSAIRVQALGNGSTSSHVTKATIDSNVIANFPGGAGVLMAGGNSNTGGGPGGSMGTPGNATNIVNITNNRIAGQSAANRMGTSAILVSVSGGNSGSRSQGNFNISNNGTVANPLTNIAGTVIGYGNNGYATSVATINSNVIVANNGFGSNGIGGGNGVVIGGETPDGTVTVSSNSISQTDGNGILFVGRGNASGSILRVKITNNTVAAPLAGVRPGIRVDSGNAASADDAVCLNISGNTSAGSGGSQGIGLRKQGTTATVNDFGIHGLPGGSTATPAVETYVDSQNPAGGGTLLISATSGFSTCSNP